VKAFEKNLIVSTVNQHFDASSIILKTKVVHANVKVDISINDLSLENDVHTVVFVTLAEPKISFVFSKFSFFFDKIVK